MTGTVFSIEEFSVYDGPGIRTTIFLKGCPLRCSWCHNPEGQNPESEILKSPNGCLRCGRCEPLSEKSIELCPMGLIRKSGESYTPQKLCEKILKNERILSRGGGVTFSGGEPCMQADFVIACSEILKKRQLNIALQTSGFCEKDTFKKLLPAVDFVLYDLKVMDEHRSKRYIGASNSVILENFASLVCCEKPFTVRIPLIPQVTDTAGNIREICRFLAHHSVNYAELMPYNKMAGSKYALAGRCYLPDFDPAIPCEAHPEIFEEYNISIKTM